MTKRPEPNRHVMLLLNLGLMKIRLGSASDLFFLLLAEAPFIPVHRTGFSGAIVIKGKPFSRGKEVFNMAMNNINLEEMKSFVEEVKQDLAKSKRTKKVECSWNFDERKPQMGSKLQHPKGETTLQSDLAPFMGGTGSAPDPIQYCLFGLAACFAGTFMSTATTMGIRIESLKVSAENSLDFSKTIGLTKNPITEKVKIVTEVKSDANKEQLKDLERLTRERCPGVYCLINPIPLELELVHVR